MHVERSYSTPDYVYRQVNEMAIATTTVRPNFPITFSAAASGDEGTWHAVLADLEQSSGTEVTRVGCFPGASSRRVIIPATKQPSCTVGGLTCGLDASHTAAVHVPTASVQKSASVVTNEMVCF